MGRKLGLSFSWKRALGISATKGKISKAIGVPLTKQGRQRKVGQIVGCTAMIVAVFVVSASLSLYSHFNSNETKADITSKTQLIATSGACSNHGGVNCSAGPTINWAVICNDGWHDSSVSFPDMEECNNMPCIAESALKTLDYDATNFKAIDNKFAPLLEEYNQAITDKFNETLTFDITKDPAWSPGLSIETLYNIDKSNQERIMQEMNYIAGMRDKMISEINNAKELTHEMTFADLYKKCLLNNIDQTQSPQQISCPINSSLNVNAQCECDSGYVPNSTGLECIPLQNLDSSFSDVSPTNQYYKAIEYVKNSGIVSGYNDNTFHPDEKINRAEFTKIITGALKIYTHGADCFPDVGNEWFSPSVCTAKEMGIISGYSDGTFKPGNYVTVPEAVKIALSAYKEAIPPAEGPWYAKYINYARNMELMPTAWEKDPINHQITRGEMAQLIFNLQNKK